MPDQTESSISIVSLRLKFEVTAPLKYPPYPGSALQGLFQNSICDYAHILHWPNSNEGDINDALGIIKLKPNIPRPYSIFPVQWGRRQILQPGAIFELDLVLFKGLVHLWRVFCETVDLRGQDNNAKGSFAGNFRLIQVKDNLGDTLLNWRDGRSTLQTADDEYIMERCRRLSQAEGWRLLIETPLQVNPIGVGCLQAKDYTAQYLNSALRNRMSKVVSYNYWENEPEFDESILDEGFQPDVFPAAELYKPGERAARAEFSWLRGVLGSILLMKRWEMFLPEIVVAEMTGLGVGTTSGKGKFKIKPVRFVEAELDL